jgi:hypothetical protein
MAERVLDPSRGSAFALDPLGSVKDKRLHFRAHCSPLVWLWGGNLIGHLQMFCAKEVIIKAGLATQIGKRFALSTTQEWSDNLFLDPSLAAVLRAYEYLNLTWGEMSGRLRIAGGPSTWRWRSAVGLCHPCLLAISASVTSAVQNILQSDLARSS